MSLKTRLENDVKLALRGGDKPRLSVLRLALANIKRREVDIRKPLDDAAAQAVLEKMIRQGQESAAQFRRGGREDLASKETKEIEILRTYLPEPLEGAELESLINEVIEATGASSVRDLGRVMGEIKARAGGRADLAVVSQRVRSLLTES